MKKLFLICCFIIASGIAGLAQHDDIYSHNLSVTWHKQMTEKLDLQSLKDLNVDFIFRYWHKGQVVDIIRNGDSLQGSMTCYFFRTHRNRQGVTLKDTIFAKTVIDAERVKAAYEVILGSGMLEIPSDSLFEGWITGHQSRYALIGYNSIGSQEVSFFSGQTYLTEVSDDESDEAFPPTEMNYEELTIRAELIDQFINDFSAILALQDEYRYFEKLSMRSEGCYTKEWESKTICVHGIYYFVGYYGSKVTPIGLYGGINFGVSGGSLSNSSIYLRHMVDIRKSYNFNAIVSRSEIFSPRSGKMPDILSYKYLQVRYERDSFLQGNTIQRHQILYKVFVRTLHLNIGVGPSYLARDISDLGALLSLGMHPFNADLAFHHDQIDYRFSYTPTFLLDSYFPIGYLQIGIIYERFRLQKGWQFYLGVVF
jgi:hypothetical protein